MEHEFVDIIGYEGKYKINKLGEIYSIVSNKNLKSTLDTNGYYVVCLGRRNKQSIHRLLAIQFIPNPNNFLIIDHIEIGRAHV